MSETWTYILVIAGVILAALTIAAGNIFIERRLLSLWQDRLGPNRVGPFGILQVVADVVKIFTKEDWVPRFADRGIFILSPTIVMITTMIVFAIIPLSPGIVVADLNIGLLFFFGFSSLGAYSLVLAGWSSNNKYALLGAMRGASQMLSYEVFMGLSLMGVVMMTGSFSMVDIVEAQKNTWFIVPQFVGFLIFLIAGLAESHRIPFDIPESESELVAGFHSEYSGMKFGMFFVGEYLGITLISALTATLFLGGWNGPAFLPPIAWLLIKVFGMIAFIILLRAALPRPRYDQLLGFGWKILLPLSLLNLLITGAIILST
ncbi:MAG TPA: NADH-quinone oxidoreductase subunit NuoH [Bacteroidales bacterium]|nr:NADH-quinone oxidoreductase subunit NuoH [Bacteroidales bacterium]HRZ48722.1 NADH-quinone oxidoreductase subunit NuoH [Bacteroidales bacterium]